MTTIFALSPPGTVTDLLKNLKKFILFLGLTSLFEASVLFLNILKRSNLFFPGNVRYSVL